MSENPALSENPIVADGVARQDVLSALLSTIRLSGSLQFCFMPTGAWQTDAAPSLARLGRSDNTMPFHVLVEGGCWMRLGATEIDLSAGDVLLFPFGAGHQLGAGADGRLIIPTQDLPPKPWREIPQLRYGDGEHAVRLLCGYVQCEALSFAPFRWALPELIHMKAEAFDSAWLPAIVRQMAEEVDRRRPGGVSMLSRLSEIVFIEILRHQIMTSEPRSVGWLAALADPGMSRCLSAIHGDPRRDWRLRELAARAGMSRSALAERFQHVLGTSPIRYLRDWRLYLASVALASSERTIASVAYEAGYATEAAFTRAFARAYGAPPAAWRAGARRQE